jgi:hypothetical protein
MCQNRSGWCKSITVNSSVMFKKTKAMMGTMSRVRSSACLRYIHGARRMTPVATLLAQKFIVTYQPQITPE